MRLLEEEGATSQICFEMPGGFSAESQEGLGAGCQPLTGHLNFITAQTPAMADVPGQVAPLFLSHPGPGL